MNLVTDADLAEQFQISIERLHELRRRNGWPCVRLGRFDIRFTPEQVEQIVRLHSEAPAARPVAVEFGGQTMRSARAR